MKRRRKKKKKSILYWVNMRCLGGIPGISEASPIPGSQVLNIKLIFKKKKSIEKRMLPVPSHLFLIKSFCIGISQSLCP